MVKRWALGVISHPRVTLLLIGCITLILAGVARGVRTDNTIGVWLPADDAEMQDYTEFRSIFGEDQFLFVAFSDVDLGDAKTRQQLETLEGDLRRLEDVAAVRGPFDGEQPDLGEFLGRHLLSADHRTVGFLIVPEMDLEPTRRRALGRAVENQLSSTSAPAGALLAGPEQIQHDLDLGSRNSFAVLSPLVLVLVSAVLWLALRSLSVVLAVQISTLLACAWAVGALVASGHTLNMVVVVIPALLVVLNTAYSLHLVSRFLGSVSCTPDKAHGWNLEARRRAWVHAVRETFAPCMWTAITTAAGLGSLALSEIPPLQHLGMFSALGVLICFALSFTFVPTVLALCPRVVPRMEPVPSQPRSSRYTAWLARHRRAVVGCSVLLAAIAVVGVSRLTVESHILRFFGPSHPLVQSTGIIEDQLLGLTPVEIWIRGRTEQVISPDSIRVLREFSNRVQREPIVSAVVSPLDADPRLAQLDADTTSGLLRSFVAQRAEADPFSRHLRGGEDQLDVRLTLACRTTASEQCQALVERLRTDIEASFPEGLDVRLTGAIPLLVRIQTMLLRTQVRSFLIALAVVTLVLFSAFRSVPLVALSLIPNALPVVLTLGWMGYAHLPLDIATVTVAAIALGIVVDDTIHYLHRFQQVQREGASNHRAVARSFESTARPLLITTLAVAVGFLAFAWAPFRPTRDFGILIAITTVTALAMDMVLLPALLLFRTRPLGNQGTLIS